MKNIKQTLINTVLPIISAVAVAGLAYAAWVEPGTTPPGGNVPAPINTGSDSQSKAGALGIWGVFKTYNTTILATNDTGNPSGNVGIGTNNPAQPSPANSADKGNVDVNDAYIRSIGKWVSELGDGTSSQIGGDCVCRFQASGYSGGGGGNMTLTLLRNCGAGWQTVLYYNVGSDWGSTSMSGNTYFPCDTDYSSYLSGDLFDGWKSSSDCISAGGTVVSDGSTKFCKFNASSCPSSWLQYNNWSETQAKTCTGTNDATCTRATNCTTGSHAFANTAVETCGYKNDIRYTGLTPGTYCSYSSVYGCFGGGCAGVPGIPEKGFAVIPGYIGCAAVEGMCSLDCTETCVTDTYNYYGCGTYYDYCTATSVTCFADVVSVGCY